MTEYDDRLIRAMSKNHVAAEWRDKLTKYVDSGKYDVSTAVEFVNANAAKLSTPPPKSVASAIKANAEARQRAGLPPVDYDRAPGTQTVIDKMTAQTARINAERNAEITATRERLQESAQLQPTHSSIDWAADAEKQRDQSLEAAYASGDDARIYAALSAQEALAVPGSMLPKPKLVDDELADGFTLEQLKAARQAEERELAEWRDRKDPHHQDDPDRNRGMD